MNNENDYNNEQVLDHYVLKENREIFFKKLFLITEHHMHQLEDDHINNEVLLKVFEDNYERLMIKNEYHSYQFHYHVLMSMLLVDQVMFHLKYIFI